MITAENAKLCQQLSVQTRLAAKIARQQEVLELKQVIQAQAKAVITQAPAPVITEPAPDLTIYTRTRAERVRLQLDRVDAMMLVESDPQKLDRLASAQARLSEQERILAGRPLPGSYRPMPERTSRKAGRTVEAWADTPQPVVSGVVPPSTVPAQTPQDGTST